MKKQISSRKHLKPWALADYNHCWRDSYFCAASCATPYSEYQNIVEQIWRTMTLQHYVFPSMQSNATFVCQTFGGKKKTPKTSAMWKRLFSKLEQEQECALSMSFRIGGVCMLSLTMQWRSALLFSKRLCCPSISFHSDQYIIYFMWTVRLDVGHVPCRLIPSTPGKRTPGELIPCRRESEQSNSRECHWHPMGVCTCLRWITGSLQSRDDKGK